MSKLNIDQKTILELFSDKKSDFLIPDYQRPYAWDEIECTTLWDDIFAFAIPNNDCKSFNETDEYFLGPIVTFRNKDNKLEIIDGQQRLTTLMLLLRAFYTKFQFMADVDSVNTRNNMAKCIWKTDEFDNILVDKLKIDSEVSSDDDKEEFLNILRTGEVKKEYKSKYAINFNFFQEKINEFINEFPSYSAYLPARIMRNCNLLPIEAENQDVALRIFSTLNDRGKPLSDSDIFKAQLYKYFSDKGEKDIFIKRWKELEDKIEKIFDVQNGSPMDDLFTKYMYYERAKQGIRGSTTEALRKFYEKDKYSLLKNDTTISNLELLADFWEKIVNQDDKYFSKEALRKLFVLKYSPNGMWEFFISVYYMARKDSDGKLDDSELCAFLDKIIAFIFAYAFNNPGVNALRTPVYPEMINLVNGNNVTFDSFKFDESLLKNTMQTYIFGNQRPITKSILTWWAYSNSNQELFSWSEPLEIEHIYAKKRQDFEKGLSNKDNLESLGNKSLLEKRINIRASDYTFDAKKEYYKGYVTSRGSVKEPTKNRELLDFANTKSNFIENDIVVRKELIINSFIDFVRQNGLII